MDRASFSETEYPDDGRLSERTPVGRIKWKKQRSFARKNRKASRPATYIGQRRNSHPRSGM